LTRQQAANVRLRCAVLLCDGDHIDDSTIYSSVSASCTLNKSMTVVPEEDNSSPDLVPETLLALAKDSRYIRQCQDLLTSIFRQGHDDDDATNFWWWSSALLYVTLVVIPKKKTLGMQFVGLQHAAPTSRWQERIGKFVVAAGWAVWMRSCIQWERRSLQDNREEQRHESLRGAARQYYFEQQRRAMMQRASRASGGDYNGQGVHDVANASSALADERTSSSDLTERIKLAVKRIVQVGSCRPCRFVVSRSFTQ
jgi:hypothetical protein